MSFIKVSKMLFNYKLSSNAMKVYIYLTVCQNKLGTAVVKAKTIGAACAINSNVTVQAAVAELEAKGLIAKYSRRSNDGDYICNGYHVTQLPQDNFVMLVDGISALKLPKCAFATYLYMVKCRNKKGRAFPSLTHLADVLNICRNSVIDAIKHLIAAGLIRKAPLWAGKHNMYIVHSRPIQQALCAIKKAACGENTSNQGRTRNTHRETVSTTIVAGAVGIVKAIQRKASLLCGWVVQKLCSSI